MLLFLNKLWVGGELRQRGKAVAMIQVKVEQDVSDGGEVVGLLMWLDNQVHRITCAVGKRESQQSGLGDFIFSIAY